MKVKTIVTLEAGEVLLAVKQYLDCKGYVVGEARLLGISIGLQGNDLVEVEVEPRHAEGGPT